VIFRSILRYLIASPLTQDPAELDQLFQTILDRRGAILIAPASTVPLAIMAAYLTKENWPFIWMGVDLFLTGARWKVMASADGASNKERRRLAGMLVWLGALWMLSMGVAIFLCFTAGHPLLMVFSAVVATGIAGVVTSRNAATPRHALLLLLLLGIPFSLGMLFSPLEGMIIPAIFTSVWIASLYLFVLQNHVSTVRLIKAEAAARVAAITDELTGLYNRKYFMELSGKLDGDAKAGRTYGLLCIDLDGFKAVNDEHGHAVGDLLLCAATERMRRSLRLDDILFRLGGDEFVALLPSAEGPDCALVARRIIDALSENFELGGVVVTIGASIGSVCSAGVNGTASSLLHAADTAMYRAKAKGKGGHIHV
jgi:diguanylate cyclase (GGDEF)-like protein